MSSDTYIKIGKQFKKARKEKKWTQDDVANKAGINTNYYAQIERGEKNPTTEVLDSIAKVLKIELKI